MTTTTNEQHETARRAWEEFRADREEGLRRPHDWLSVVGFLWVPREPATLGDVPGRWWDDGETVHVSATTEERLTLLGSGDGAPRVLDGEAGVTVGEAGAARFATTADDVLVEVLRRGGYGALRLRDPQAPARLDFTGVPTFPYDPAWRRPARLEPYPEPRSVRVGAAAPGLTQLATAVGEVVVDIDGEEHRLVATGREGDWSLSFVDATSGAESAAWRAVPVTELDGGRAVVDFNRAVNFPYAFSDFGTCPRPIDGNVLPVAVPAGEKAPTGRTGVPRESGGPTALPGEQLLP